MIQTVDNYQTIKNTTNRYYFRFDSRRSHDNQDKKVIKNKLEITLSDYLSQPHTNTFFSFFQDSEKQDVKNQDDLIVSINKQVEQDGKENYFTQTGNYVGKFVWQSLEIDIKSRFSNVFLERMLNFANDIYLDDVSISGQVGDLDISRYIIFYMFVQNLEKAFLLGLPKSYRSVNHHEMKLKGKIDINRFIKYDIPFQGKISSTSREQQEIQEIVDVLFRAVKIIESSEFSTKNISHIKTHLKQHRSNKYISNETINKALNSKALQNPIFTPYKKVLEYARFIINGNNIESKAKGDKETYGFIINIAELFEIYVTNLLRHAFPDWSVESPKITLYDSMFYSRKIIPDIVMTKGNDVMVFDTKYKRMKMRGTRENVWDLDRNDFFQINTYMSYYQNQNMNIIAGGLLYPMESFEQSKCHSGHWFGSKKTKFIVDGLQLENQDLSKEDILKAEKEFLDRIQSLLHR
jgi:5-methylcytosine-specific restriction endonuclease McrBC regulatory subunit McrC